MNIEGENASRTLIYNGKESDFSCIQIHHESGWYVVSRQSRSSTAKDFDENFKKEAMFVNFWDLIDYLRN